MQGQIKKKYVVSVAMILLFISLTVGVTLAFYRTNTDSLKNDFTPTKAACQVVENFDGITKRDVAVRNTGNIKGYIRAKILVNWMSDDRSKVTAKSPEKDVDYIIQYTDDTNWELAWDGFWYYKTPVNPGDVTENLVELCKLSDNADVPEGFYLSVEIVSTAIQASPAKAVLEGWKSGVSSVDGTTLTIRQKERADENTY